MRFQASNKQKQRLFIFIETPYVHLQKQSFVVALEEQQQPWVYLCSVHYDFFFFKKNTVSLCIKKTIIYT